MTTIKYNCHNCKFLECTYGGVIDDRIGYICHKRNYKTEKQEIIHLKQLDNDSYLNKSKRCFEINERIK